MPTLSFLNDALYEPSKKLNYRPNLLHQNTHRILSQTPTHLHSGSKTRSLLHPYLRVGTELVVIDTRLVRIEAVGPFKLLFLKCATDEKSCILELCKPSLGCHFSYINCSCMYIQLFRTFQLGRGGDCRQITRLTEILKSHDLICHRK